ncbi:unnamed protein product [Calypogeia fissa]
MTMGTVVPMAQGAEEVVVRFYNKETDLARVVDWERKCEAGPGGQVALLQDVLGDPLCRVRHFPAYTMLVAEIGTEIVGVIRAGIKVLVCGKKGASAPSPVGRGLTSVDVPVYTRAGYILGLRVSAAHRRMGIGHKLAVKMEDWCKEQGAEYVYFATTKDNEASVKLFTKRLQYEPFRNPAILIQPVFVHSRPAPAHVEFTKLSPEAAIAFYRARLGTQEFFPKDIDKVLDSKLCAGTWVATLRDDDNRRQGGRAGRFCCGGASCRVSEESVMGSIEETFAGCDKGMALPESWAVLSLWKCNEIFKLEVKGVSLMKRSLAYMSRVADKALPWFRIPSIPNLFTSFGMQFMFGLHAEGCRGDELMTSLCWHAHNQSRELGCQVLMTEVGANDPIKKCIPHWNMFSSDDDLFCVKRLEPTSATCTGKDSRGELQQHLRRSSEPNSSTDWSRAPAVPGSLFMDPRDV